MYFVDHEDDDKSQLDRVYSISTINEHYDWAQYVTAHSSIFFTTIIFHAILKNHWSLAASWLVLTITSILHHNHFFGKPMKYIDYTAVYACIAVGAFFIFKNLTLKETIVPLACSLFVLMIFWVGYIIKSYAWDEDIKKQYDWHKLLHLVTTFAFHYVFIVA
jgi:hypothetical protein